MPERDLRARGHAASRKRHRGGCPLDCGEKGLLAGRSGCEKSCEQAVACSNGAATIWNGAHRGAQLSVGENRTVATKACEHCAGAPRAKRVRGCGNICEGVDRPVERLGKLVAIWFDQRWPGGE